MLQNKSSRTIIKSSILYMFSNKIETITTRLFHRYHSAETQSVCCYRLSPPVFGGFDFVNPDNPIRCCECLFQVFKLHIFISYFNSPCSVIPVPHIQKESQKTKPLIYISLFHQVLSNHHILHYK